VRVCGGGSALGSGGGTQSPQIVARPPNLAALLTHCRQLILRKISKFDATRYQILRLKCTKFHKTAPQTRWGSLQRSPHPLAVFKGPTSKGKGGKGRGQPPNILALNCPGHWGQLQRRSLMFTVAVLVADSVCCQPVAKSVTLGRRFAVSSPACPNITH